MIYLDNASTTKIFDSVNQKIATINSDYFYNPSALYKPSIDILAKIALSREEISRNLGTSERHIIFTSGATESNNMAIIGFSTAKKDAEYIFSEGEHPSVYNVAKSLKMAGKTVHFIPLKNDGAIDEDAFKKCLNKNTYFISIIHVSNETGAINDIEKLCKIAKEFNPQIIFHSDGTQAFGKIIVNVEKLMVDSYTISAHKFHGPKGVGALYVREMTKIKPIILGGGQQLNYRSGTENVSGIIGMCMASSIAVNNIENNAPQILAFREYVKQEIKAKCDNFVINEAPNNSPYILSISFKGIRGEVLLHMLEKQGVLLGIGSACSSKKSNNIVLQQTGLDKQYILGSIRISFSCFNTAQEIKIATEKIIEQYKILKGKIDR